MEEITLEIIEKDLLKIIPERSDDIIRYFKLLQHLNNNKFLAKVVNSESEFNDIEQDTLGLYNEVADMKKRQQPPNNQKETSGTISLKVHNQNIRDEKVSGPSDNIQHENSNVSDHKNSSVDGELVLPSSLTSSSNTKTNLKGGKKNDRPK